MLFFSKKMWFSLRFKSVISLFFGWNSGAPCNFGGFSLAYAVGDVSLAWWPWVGCRMEELWYIKPYPQVPEKNAEMGLGGQGIAFLLNAKDLFFCWGFRIWFRSGSFFLICFFWIFNSDCFWCFRRTTCWTRVTPYGLRWSYHPVFTLFFSKTPRVWNSRNSQNSLDFWMHLWDMNSLDRGDALANTCSDVVFGPCYKLTPKAWKYPPDN